jgi:hypothetical protein
MEVHMNQLRQYRLGAACALILALAGCGGGIDSYTVAGTVAGLGTGTSVVLGNVNGDQISVSSNGAFAFPSDLSNGAAYSGTVVTAPAGETCLTSNEAGTISNMNVTNVEVVCAPNP